MIEMSRADYDVEEIAEELDMEETDVMEILEEADEL